MPHTKGFVTIATGNRWYYTIALHLLRSYRLFAKEPLPFAILAEEENEITSQFDKVILLDLPSRSYIDKLRLAEDLPFDETIFIDADCLAYGDLNELFDIFQDASDVSCLGITEPLTEKTNGWFSLLSFPTAGEGVLTREMAQAQLPYAVGLHGGMIYMRRSDLTKKVFGDARQLARDYSAYRFRTFDKPADEPVLALSMALNHCKPIPYERFALTCFWVHKPRKLDLYHGKACRKDKTPITLLHWGTRHTQTPIYKKQIDQLKLRLQNKIGLPVLKADLTNTFHILRYRIRKKLHR